MPIIVFHFSYSVFLFQVSRSVTVFYFVAITLETILDKFNDEIQINPVHVSASY